MLIPAGNTEGWSPPFAEQLEYAYGPISASYSDIKHIAERERLHHAFVRVPRFSKDEEFLTVFGEEFTLANYLERLDKFAIRVSAKQESPIARFVDRKNRNIVSLTKIGRTARDLCGEFNAETLAFYTHHQFSPRLGCMLDAMRKWADIIRSLPLATIDTKGVAPMELFFAEIYRSLKSKRISSAIKNHRRMERQNFRSCWSYIHWLFEHKRSRLLILRLDLYFRPLAKDWGASIDAEKVHSSFLRGLREDRIIKNVIGWISKREVGIDRGVHYHVLVAVDGHEHRDAANLTRMLGERWVEMCGEEPEETYPRASYFNCYTLKDWYKYNCIGLVRLDNKQMMEGLKAAIRYMCKETCHLKAGPIEIVGSNGELVKKGAIGKRNIRKGITTTFLGKKRGAPRKVAARSEIWQRA